MVNEKKQRLEEIPRRRGRPSGRNRIPLSREERRARNAQYERERRNETAEAMSQLIEAANCDPDISLAELLATVIHRTQRAKKRSVDITDLERINRNLEAQIETLQGRLRLHNAPLQVLDGQEHSQSDLTSPENVELPRDVNLIEYTFLQQKDDQEPTQIFLTDADKDIMLSDYIGADFLENR